MFDRLAYAKSPVDTVAIKLFGGGLVIFVQKKFRPPRPFFEAIFLRLFYVIFAQVERNVNVIRT